MSAHYSRVHYHIWDSCLWPRRSQRLCYNTCNHHELMESLTNLASSLPASSFINAEKDLLNNFKGKSAQFVESA